MSWAGYSIGHRVTSPLRGEVGAKAPGEGFTLAVQAEGTSPLTLTLSSQGRGDQIGDRLERYNVRPVKPKDH